MTPTLSSVLSAVPDLFLSDVRYVVFQREVCTHSRAFFVSYR